MIRYGAMVEVEDRLDRPAIEAMIAVQRALESVGDSVRVRWIQRLDAIWCEECNHYHDGDRERLVD